MAEIAVSAETLYLTGICARERGLEAAIPPETGPGFDWAGFVETADRHKVLGLAYRAFSRARAPSPPSEILARLKREAASKEAAKAMLLAEWRRVDEALRGASIRVMMIKGPALSLQLYGDPDARGIPRHRSLGGYWVFGTGEGGLHLDRLRGALPLFRIRDRQAETAE